jgi:hypothetical protein
MVTAEHAAWFVRDEALTPQPAPMPEAIADALARIGENCEPALCTVLFMAGAAAAIIGNAVDLPGHDAIDRGPASDLRDRLVTFDVGALTEAATETALDAGAEIADILATDGLIAGAVLALRGSLRIRHRSLALLEST